MRQIQFYTTSTGRCPVQEELDDLPDKTVQKIAWVLRVVRDLDHVPANYFKKLVNTDDIWEVRAKLGNNAFRLLGFLDDGSLVILTNWFAKKKVKKHQRLKLICLNNERKNISRGNNHG